MLTVASMGALAATLPAVIAAALAARVQAPLTLPVILAEARFKPLAAVRFSAGPKLPATVSVPIEGAVMAPPVDHEVTFSERMGTELLMEDPLTAPARRLKPVGMPPPI